jgi:tetratricopeptide (TPR) repeat protein
MRNVDAHRPREARRGSRFSAREKPAPAQSAGAGLGLRTGYAPRRGEVGEVARSRGGEVARWRREPPLGEGWRLLTRETIVTANGTSPLHLHVTNAMITRRQRVATAKLPRRVPAAPPNRDRFEVLKELPSPLGVELLLLVGQVWLTALTPAGARPRLFPKNTAPHIGDRRNGALKEAPADLREDLRTLMRVSGRRPPADREIALACEAVSEWAQALGYRRIALQFIEASAAIVPRDPYFAWIAGRANRLLGDHKESRWRAEAFYDRAIRYAYRELNWYVYIRAHLGYGRLCADRGLLQEAVAHYESASSACVDQGHDWLAALTLHDAVGVCFQRGNIPLARKYATEALRLYPRHNERFPLAVHDALFLYLVDNHFAEIEPLLKVLYTIPVPLHEQVLVASTLARTSGLLRHSDEYARCESRVLHLAGDHTFHTAAALVNLAFGAWGLADQDLAKRYALRAIELGEEMNDKQAVEVGRTVLSDLERGILAPGPVPITESAQAAELARLTAIVTENLVAWHGGTWTRKEGDQLGPDDVGPV